MLDDYSDEFALPKEELTLQSFVNYENVEIFLLDRISVDYPTVLRAASPEDFIPIYGAAIYGDAKYPIGEWGLTILSTDHFKVMGREIFIKGQLVNLILRRI